MTIAIRTITFCFIVLGLAIPGAEAYPVRNVTIVVPSAPGGVADMLGRLLAQRLSDAWGQQVIVDNKPGANNQIGAEHVARAAPDGHTLLVAPDTAFVANASLYRKLRYDPFKDFAPISGLVGINQALIVHPAVPVNNVKELVALGHKNPGTLNYGTFGIGSPGHLNMEMFQLMTGAKFVPVHYRGANPALTDLIAGHVQILSVSIGSAIQPWKTGTAKLLAIGSTKRIPTLPDVPTVMESGVPDFEAVVWFGLFARAGTPAEIVGKINTEVQSMLSDPIIRAKYMDPQLFHPIVGSPEQFAATIKVEEAKWKKLIKAAKINVD
jgi:tripartite-type tricarboxylate transporter receptor subunit TctC